MDWYQYLDGNVVLEAGGSRAMTVARGKTCPGSPTSAYLPATRSRFPISPLACHIAYESINSVSHLTLYVEMQYRIERV